jgi:Mg-chelatase subunit ChlD
MKTRLLCCSLVFAAALAHSEEQKPVSSVQIKGQGNAAGTEIALNQIAMDQFPSVQVFVTVLKDGKPQSGLTAADFRVREDEVDQQPLTVESQLPPLSVIIAIDNSGSMRPRLADTRQAAKSFLDLLAPADSVQVVGFAQQVKVLGPMSSNRSAAGKAIELTTARGNTALYDALFTSVDLLKDRPGRKAVVLLSDGVDDNGVGKQLSKYSLQEVLQFAKHRDRITERKPDDCADRNRCGVAASSVGAESLCNRRYSPNSCFAFPKQSTAKWRSSIVCAADTWVRIRAVPCGTTG